MLKSGSINSLLANNCHPMDMLPFIQHCETENHSSGAIEENFFHSFLNITVNIDLNKIIFTREYKQF